MSKRVITIDPVTRIEGHARVILNVSDDRELESARLIVNELRGFERILVGMEADSVPLVTARICGVCPAAHHLAASKALDAACGVEPPEAAKLLRELLFMGHFIHSHALSLFVLEGPDLVLGLDGDPAERNIVGVVRAAPEVAAKALRCRTLGQKIGEMVGGRGTHPVTSVAGGITFQLDTEKRETLSKWIDEALVLITELVTVGKSLLLKLIEKHACLGNEWQFPSWHMGTVRDGETLNFYEGTLRIIDEKGALQAEFPSSRFEEHLCETTVDWSYMKEVWIQQNSQRHLYRVGPLARLNCAGRIGTPAAEKEFRQFRDRCGHPAQATVMQTYARLIELLYAAERAQQIIADPAILGETRVPARFRGGRGIGHVEAPRGTLIHDYEIDSRGIVRSANLIVATQQNYTAINRSIEQAARSFVIGKAGEDALLNAIEFSIRCYDPCLSCATHAYGSMPLEVILKERDREITRVRR